MPLTPGDVSFGSNIDLQSNEIRNVKLQILGSDPTAAEAKVYYNSGDKTVYYYNGTAWKPLWVRDTTELAGTGLSATDADTIEVDYGSISGSPSFGQSNSNGVADSAARSDHYHALPAHDAAAHSAIKISDLASPATNVAWNNKKITGLANGTDTTDAATVGQVQAAATGLDVKLSVRVASTANVTATYNATGGTSGRGQFTSAPNTLDDETLVDGDRILLKNQSTGAQNGIWVVTSAGSGANGTWDRATDFDSDGEVNHNAFTFVEEGTAGADTGWILTTDNPITIGGAGGTSLAWTQFSGAGTYTAGDGLTLTGTTFAVGAGTGISVGADTVGIDTAVVPRKYAETVGNASDTDFTLTHNLGTRDIMVSVREVASPYTQVFISSEALTTNTVKVYFASAPSLNQYRVTVIG